MPNDLVCIYFTLFGHWKHLINIFCTFRLIIFSILCSIFNYKTFKLLYLYPILIHLTLKSIQWVYFEHLDLSFLSLCAPFHPKFIKLHFSLYFASSKTFKFIQWVHFWIFKLILSLQLFVDMPLFVVYNHLEEWQWLGSVAIKMLTYCIPWKP